MKCVWWPSRGKIKRERERETKNDIRSMCAFCMCGF